MSRQLDPHGANVDGRDGRHGRDGDEGGGRRGSAASPRHHVPDEILDAYVAGHSAQAAALAIACHVTLCPRCRGRMRLLEELAGMSLEAAPAAALAPGAWEAMLPRLDPRTDERGQLEKDPLPDFLAGYRLPRPILRALTGSEPLRWRFLAPGARFIDLGISATLGEGVGGAAGGSIARLLKLSPGLEIPLHDHQGPEYTVIFTGALQEDGALFSRGDLAFRLPGHRHVQHVDRREDCVALQVNEGPLTPLTWKGKLLNLIAGSRS